MSPASPDDDPRPLAHLVDEEPYQWTLFRTGDQSLWLWVIKNVSSAMYRVIRKIGPDDPAWTTKPTRDWIEALVRETCAHENSYLNSPESAEFGRYRPQLRKP